MEKVAEGFKYEWHFDKLQGVGRFIRKLDGEVSPMETGADAKFINDCLINGAEYIGLSVDYNGKQYTYGDDASLCEVYGVATRPNARVRWRLLPNVFPDAITANAFKTSRESDNSNGTHEWRVFTMQLPAGEV